MKDKFELSLDNKTIIVEVGSIAQQTSGSAVVHFGQTVVLSTFCCSENDKNTDFFPLVINYEEKMYADYRIPNVFTRREGKANEREILISRLLDRAIRPMFCDGFRKEMQVINVVMSYDHDCATEVASLLGSSLSICISDIPFDGPVAGVFVGKVNGKLILNPDFNERKKSNINIFVAGNIKGINMIESDADEISEDDMIEAIEFAFQAIKRICIFQQDIINKVGKKKKEINFNKVDEKLKNDIRCEITDDISKAISSTDKIYSRNYLARIKQNVISKFENKNFNNDQEKNNFFLMLGNIIEQLIGEIIRNKILNEKIRPDGRKLEEIRNLEADINILPHVHGSGIFSRGQTQVISVTTLSTLDDKQSIDNLSDEKERFFMHHYNFHPFSVGEISNISLGRREIGHGKLGEKALKHIIPLTQDFPFSIRTVSEVVGSNGSSSQASICASCLSLINAGVPIKSIISGVAMGLITKKSFDIDNVNKNDYEFLVDIQDLEDHYGDMDFKVSSTYNGITALQLDLKIKAITIDMLREALQIANKACSKIRLFLQEIVNNKGQESINKNTLKVKKINVTQDRIREIIGPNGKNINEIINECDNCRININNDGKIYIYHSDYDVIDRATNCIENIASRNNNLKEGDKFNATITRIEKFGVFVSLNNDNIALCHISQLDNKRIDNIFEKYHVGDHIDVVITEIDKQTGKIKVSHKDLIQV